MEDQKYLKLQSSEAAVAAVAAQIFSAYVAAGKVADHNESLFLDKSIALAIRLAKRVDDAVESDAEKET